MHEEPTTPDPVEPARENIEAASERDFDVEGARAAAKHLVEERA